MQLLKSENSILVQNIF